jgi:ferritin
MAAYFKDEDLDGFANFFLVQAEEERFHAMKFFNFIDEMGEKVEVRAFKQPKTEFDSIEDVYKLALEHEQFVTKRIYKLMDLAQGESEYATISFLKWFIDEQVEEEDTMETILKKVQRFGENSQGIYMLDEELAQRTFAPPTEGNE